MFEINLNGQALKQVPNLKEVRNYWKMIDGLCAFQMMFF